MPSNNYCCVVKCGNKYGNTVGVSFYSFPSRSWEVDRRQVWINFVKRLTMDGKPWLPAKHSVICSQHFVGNKKSEHPSAPNYNPTVYNVKALGEKKQQQQQNRFNRLQVRRATRPAERNCVQIDNDENKDPLPPVSNEPAEKINESIDHTTEVSVQTEKEDSTELVDNETQTVNPTMKRVEVQTLASLTRMCIFSGYESVMNNDEKLKNLTSVSRNVFSCLLTMLPTKDKLATNEITWENKLLLTLIKIKSDPTFLFLSAMFDISPSAASSSFKTVLSILCQATSEWIIWPSKYTIQTTMPPDFKQNYSNCRVIIDCTEIFTERPPTVDQRVSMYSHYKGTWTAKFLIGITPSGSISFISKAYGGRSTDIFITNNCGIIHKLEKGDMVMADKGFPNIQINENTILVMPPFASKNVQFTPEQNTEGYKIASVRIHVERAIGRLKIYNILKGTLTNDLLCNVDKIIHLCCVLTNLQPPIIKS